MNLLQDELVERLKHGMAVLQLNQAQLAERTGVSQGNISRILRGQRTGTSVATWARLLEVVEGES